MANTAKRGDVSCSAELARALKQRAAERDVPPNAYAELVIARALGMSLDELPKRTAKWAPKVFGQEPSA